jgi:DNA-binding transcriptional ArsR family regulator
VASVPMTPELLDLLAERFRALGEPARLQILNALRGGERTVGELIESTGLGQANVSKHLQLLHATGFAARRKEGLHVYYRLADPGVFGICDVMCGRVEEEARSRHALLSAR